MHGFARIILSASLVCTAFSVGCGDNKQEAQSAYNQQQAYPPQQGYPQQQPGYPQQQPGYPQQQPYPQQPATPQQPYPQQPGAPQAGGQPSAGASAQSVDVSMAAAIQPALQQLGRSQAPAGAKPLGGIFAANFGQGQTYEQSIQLQANKCYTVVAAGLPGVNEVNIKLMPPLVPTTLAQDNSTGPQATLGANPNCWKNGPFPAPMRVVLEVASGQGVVAAQIYEK
jgi:hypothetical protein